ncbi:MAG TPA: BlaI/MecI/CopY family transcriptional regulator [Thermoanaerobaculia bacterium]
MHRRKGNDQLTPLELEIMQVLWSGGPAAVAAVQERLGGRLAYTTVQTMLNVLVRKGNASRTLVDRAYHYSAAISRESALGATLHDVVQRIFGGSAEALVMSLVETKQLTPETLRRLNGMLEEEERRGSDR